MTISATCSMSSLLIAVSAQLSACPENGAHTAGHHPEQTQKTAPDCSLKPCFETQTNAFSTIDRLAKPDLPVFILCLIWTVAQMFPAFSSARVPRLADPPSGRRIPLIYRFCTLLN